MKFFELILTVMLKKNVFFPDSGYMIGKNINKLMLLDEKLKEIHPKRQFKNYVFDNFYPLEKDKFYKKDKLYVFKIRGIEYQFMSKIQRCLLSLKSDDFEVISVSCSKVEQRRITELYTINPMIITVNNKPWLQEDDLNLLKRRIEANLEKKYNNFFNDEIDLKDKFIESIEFKNKSPMYFTYKGGIKLLGNKIALQVQNNDDAQKAAFLSMAVGIGEKNSSVGAGFCSAR